MGLSDWFNGRRSADGAGSRESTPRATVLTMLERRRMQRDRHNAEVREAMDKLFESQLRLRDAIDRDDFEAIEAAGRDLALAAAELRLLHEMPGQ